MISALPPGPRLPRHIQAWLWFRRPTRFLESCRRRYGDQFTIRLPRGLDMVQVSAPELVRAVLTGDGDALHAGEANRDLLEPLVGANSVLLLDGAAHLRQRKLMLPAVHGERASAWTSAFAEVTAREVEGWPRDVPFPLRPAMQRITMEVILELVFGVGDDGRRAELSRLLAAVSRMAGRPLRIALTQGLHLAGQSPWERFVAVRESLDSELFRLIRERRVDPGLADRVDVFSELVRARDVDGEAMSDQEIRDELVTLLVAGHETTATALAWAFDLLLHDPATLHRLEAEAAGDRREYLDATIKETLRLRPPVVIVVRRVKVPFPLDGREVPAGAHLCPNIYLTQRRPDLYPEPDRFRPERFLEEAPEPYAWLPFGGGIRRCLGASFATAEMRVVIPEMLRRVRLRPASPRPERVRRETVLLVPDRGTRVVASGRSA